MTATFDETKHPRHPAGTDKGGEFAKKGAGEVTRGADPNWWSSVPPLYHLTTRDRLDSILEGGLREGDQSGEDAPARAGHVYAYTRPEGVQEYWHWGEIDPADAVLIEIDPRQLDPAQLKADEDYADFITQEREFAAEGGELNVAAWENVQVRGGETLAEWADSYGFDTPEQVRASYDEFGTIAYEGVIPPEAITVREDLDPNTGKPLQASAWDPSKHPRQPKGNRTGGQFAPSTFVGEQGYARGPGKVHIPGERPRMPVAEIFSHPNVRLEDAVSDWAEMRELDPDYETVDVSELVPTQDLMSAVRIEEYIQEQTEADNLPELLDSTRVVQGDDGRLYVADGHNRIAAAVKLGNAKLYLPVIRRRITAAGFVEAQHPRHPAGTEEGGQFAPKMSPGTVDRIAEGAANRLREEREVVPELGELFAKAKAEIEEQREAGVIPPKANVIKFPKKSKEPSKVSRGEITGFPDGMLTPDDSVVFWPKTFGERDNAVFWKAWMDPNTGEQSAFWFVDGDGKPHHLDMANHLGLPLPQYDEVLQGPMRVSGFGPVPDIGWLQSYFQSDMGMNAYDASKLAVTQGQQESAFQRVKRFAEDIPSQHRKDIRDAQEMMEASWGVAASALFEEDALVAAEARLQRQYEKVYRRAAKRAATQYQMLTKVVTAAGQPQPEEVLAAEALLASFQQMTGAARREMLREILKALEIIEEARGQAANAAVVQYIDLLRAQVGVQASRLVAGAQDAVADVLLSAMAEGWSVPTTAQAIQEKLESVAPWQATMLARTDLVALANGASVQRAVQLEDPNSAFKTWLATPDERTRINHRHAHGQTVPVAQPFTVGGEQLLFPGDPAASDGNVINCRCTVVYSALPEGPAGIMQVVMKPDLAISAAGWNEAQHPRDPRGTATGGQWRDRAAGRSSLQEKIKAERFAKGLLPRGFPAGHFAPEKGVKFWPDKMGHARGNPRLPGPLWKALIDEDGNEVAFWFASDRGIPNHEHMIDALNLNKQATGWLGYASGFGPKVDSATRRAKEAAASIPQRHRRDIRDANEYLDERNKDMALAASSWDESAHPRWPAGSEQGGEFRPKEHYYGARVDNGGFRAYRMARGFGKLGEGRFDVGPWRETIQEATADAREAYDAEEHIDWSRAEEEFDKWQSEMAGWYEGKYGYHPDYFPKMSRDVWRRYQEGVLARAQEINQRLRETGAPFTLEPYLNPSPGGDIDQLTDTSGTFTPDFNLEMPGDEGGMDPGFTIWTHADGHIEVEDVLDITDTDFFPEGPDSPLVDRYVALVDKARGLPEQGGFVTLYRGMSDAEMDAWDAGEEIPLGKFFTSIPTVQYAQDINAQPPHLQTFKVPRNMVTEVAPNEFQLKKRGRLNRGQIEAMHASGFPESLVRTFEGMRDRGYLFPAWVPELLGLKADGVPYVGEGGMVCLYPTPEEAEKIARRKGQPAEDLHVTLLFFEDGVPEGAEEAIAGIPFEGLKGEITGIARFREGADGVPIVALVSAPGLGNLRADLARALPGYSERHDFMPHVTLGYDDVADPEGALGLPVTFSTVKFKNKGGEPVDALTAAGEGRRWRGPSSGPNWDPADHPRHPEGSAKGGEFAPKGDTPYPFSPKYEGEELKRHIEEVDDFVAELEGKRLPPAPGTAPIPAGHVRLYHYTEAPAEVIRREGLKMSAAKGESYMETNQIWANPRLPEPTTHVIAEFSVPAIGDERMDFGRMTPGTTNNGEPWTAETWADRLVRHGSDVTFLDDIKPEEIIAVHEPWQQHARYILENYPDLTVEQLDDLRLKELGEDYAKADDYLRPLTAAAWDPAQHPRHPAGDERGGEFAPKDSVVSPALGAQNDGTYKVNTASKLRELLAEYPGMEHILADWPNLSASQAQELRLFLEGPVFAERMKQPGSSRYKRQAGWVLENLGHKPGADGLPQVSGPTRSVMDKIQIGGGMIGPDMMEATRLVDRTVAFPKVPGEPSITMKAVGGGRSRQAAYYRYRGSRKPEKIVVARNGVNILSSVTHELGHYLDNLVGQDSWALGFAGTEEATRKAGAELDRLRREYMNTAPGPEQNRLASEISEASRKFNATRPPQVWNEYSSQQADGAFRPVVDAIKQTEMYKTLEGSLARGYSSSHFEYGGRTWSPGQSHVRYLLKPEEMVARSFEQYMAAKNPDSRLKRTMRHIASDSRLLPPEYPGYMVGDDLAKVNAAWEQTLERRGLLKKKGFDPIPADVKQRQAEFMSRRPMTTPPPRPRLSETERKQQEVMGEIERILTGGRRR